MSIHAKQRLVSQTEEAVGDFLTVTQTRKVTATLNDQLVNFEVEELHSDEVSLDLLQAFLTALQIEGRTVKTINRYSYMLENMIKKVGVPIEQITTDHLRDFLASERERGLSDASLEGARSIYSSFFGWLWKESLIRTNPCANIGAIKCPKIIKLPFTAVDIERLKTSCKTIRDKAIVCFLLSTGARVSEVCELNRASIDFQQGECKVFGKGNKERFVYLDDVTSVVLQEYLNSRTDNNPALFVGQQGRLTPQGIRAMLKVLEVRSGVENVHPHRFRRTLATQLNSHGMPVQEVARILGHEKLDTTMTYVYINDKDVKNSYHRYR